GIGWQGSLPHRRMARDPSPDRCPAQTCHRHRVRATRTVDTAPRAQGPTPRGPGAGPRKTVSGPGSPETGAAGTALRMATIVMPGPIRCLSPRAVVLPWRGQETSETLSHHEGARTLGECGDEARTPSMRRPPWRDHAPGDDDRAPWECHGDERALSS